MRGSRVEGRTRWRAAPAAARSSSSLVALLLPGSPPFPPLPPLPEVGNGLRSPKGDLWASAPKPPPLTPLLLLPPRFPEGGLPPPPSSFRGLVQRSSKWADACLFDSERRADKGTAAALSSKSSLVLERSGGDGGKTPRSSTLFLVLGLLLPLRSRMDVCSCCTGGGEGGGGGQVGEQVGEAGQLANGEQQWWGILGRGSQPSGSQPSPTAAAALHLTCAQGGTGAGQLRSHRRVRTRHRCCHSAKTCPPGFDRG